jgi:putative DNA primase/helicase
MLDEVPAWLIAASKTSSTPVPFMAAGARNISLASYAGYLVRKFDLTGESLANALHALNNVAPNPLHSSEVDQIAISVSKYSDLANTTIQDIPLSRKISSLLQPRFRHTASNGWFAYDGTKWAADPSGLQLREAVKRWMELIEDAMKRTEDPMGANDARSLTSRTKLNSVVALVESDAQLVIPLDAFDADSNLLNLKNGTLELDTFLFREHRPEDLLTQIADVAYDQVATCPAFDSFLEDVLPVDVGSFTLRLLGYSLLGNPAEHVFIMMHGYGRNGKTTLANVIGHILGDYAANAEPSTFIKVKSERIRSDLARLRSKRFVTTSELARGEVLDAALLKRLTGGDRITSRGLYKEETEMIFQALVVMTTNALPVIDGSDNALARRLILIPFERTFSEAEVDHSLGEKLKKEASGILNRLLHGLKDYRARGLAQPESIRAAATEYVEGADLVEMFLRDFTERKADKNCSATSMYSAYNIEMVMAGLKPLSRPQFKATLVAKGYRQIRSKQQREWVGITLRQRSLLH